MTASTMTAPSTYQHNMGAQVSEFAAPAQVFPFLNLPPELRNRIYYHIGEDFVASGSTPVEYHDLASSPVESVLPYLSLASVCRQIRYEFLPIFMKNQTIRVHIRHALALMSTLFPYESCHSNTLAGLTFRIEATLSKPDTSDFHMDADIRALLRLCLNAPAIQCNFTTSYATSPETSKTLEKLTNLFFQVERRDAWKSAITNDIARVVLSESNHERVRTVNLIMQPSFEKNWKIALPNGFGGVPGDDMWPFLERLGFEKKMKRGEGGIAVRVSRI